MVLRLRVWLLVMKVTAMNNEAQLKALGFKFGNSGAHTSRSMMIEELKILLFGRPENATLEDYREDIEVFNVLQKTKRKCA